MSKKDNLNEALKNAVHVSNDLELKTAIKQKTLAIISTDIALYTKLLKKFPKEKVSKITKTVGKSLTILGTAITLGTGGILSGIGLPIAGAGALIGVSGMVADDYSDYRIFMDYDNRRVAFVKVKGNPKVKI